MNCPLVVDKCPVDCPDLTKYGCGCLTREELKQLADRRAMEQSSKIREG